MKKILLLILTVSLFASCNKDSSSSPPPAPVGADGETLVGTRALSFGYSQNDGMVDVPKGKDLVLVMGFHLPKELKGQLRVDELQTSMEKQFELLPKPINNKTQDLMDSFCFPSNVPHRWALNFQGEVLPLVSGDAVSFEYGATLYLIIETRSVPKCEQFFYSFNAEVLDPTRKPDPDPTPRPIPTPTPSTPAGSEPLNLNPYQENGFNIIYDKSRGRNFTYEVSMILDGPSFAKNETVEKIFVNIFDKNSETYVSEWTEVASFNPASKMLGPQLFKFTLNKFTAPVFFIERQKDMILAFAVNSPTQSPLPFRSLDIGRYCLQNPRSFLEANTGNMGCPNE